MSSFIDLNPAERSVFFHYPGLLPVLYDAEWAFLNQDDFVAVSATVLPSGNRFFNERLRLNLSADLYPHVDDGGVMSGLVDSYVAAAHEVCWYSGVAAVRFSAGGEFRYPASVNVSNFLLAQKLWNSSGWSWNESKPDSFIDIAEGWVEADEVDFSGEVFDSVDSLVSWCSYFLSEGRVGFLAFHKFLVGTGLNMFVNVAAVGENKYSDSFFFSGFHRVSSHDSRKHDALIRKSLVRKFVGEVASGFTVVPSLAAFVVHPSDVRKTTSWNVAASAFSEKFSVSGVVVDGFVDYREALVSLVSMLVEAYSVVRSHVVDGVGVPVFHAAAVLGLSTMGFTGVHGDVLIDCVREWFQLNSTPDGRFGMLLSVLGHGADAGVISACATMPDAWVEAFFA